jgi:hypothetical protein
MCFFHGLTVASRPGPTNCRGFTITFRHTIFGRTPMDEWSARRRGLCQPTHNIRKKGGIRNRNPNKRETADPRLKPRPLEPVLYQYTQRLNYKWAIIGTCGLFWSMPPQTCAAPRLRLFGLLNPIFGQVVGHHERRIGPSHSLYLHCTEVSQCSFNQFPGCNSKPDRSVWEAVAHVAMAASCV